MTVNSVSAAGFGYLAPTIADSVIANSVIAEPVIAATADKAVVTGDVASAEDAAMANDMQAAFEDFFARILASFSFLSLLSIRSQSLDTMRYDRVSDDLRSSERALERDRLIALRAAQSRDMISDLAEKAAIEAQMVVHREGARA